MDYTEAIEYLFPLVRYGTKLGLDNIEELLSKIGNPHRPLRVIHVVGSKGKGSVCAFISSILREAGYKVGTFTSPHLVDFIERIRVNWEPIPQHDVVRFTGELKQVAEEMTKESIIKSPTFFEMTTAMAFKYFEERSVDFVVMEAGMGGRFDSTNVADPILAVITHISMEHAEHLGRSLNRIAKDKAGIIKEGIPVILAEESRIVRERCEEKGCQLTVLGRDIEFGRDTYDLSGQNFWVQDGERRSFHIDLLGNYQVENAALAYAASLRLRDLGHEISDGSIERGLGKVKWPARMQVLQYGPFVVVDTTHDVSGSGKLVESLDELFEFDKATLVFGALEDKDVNHMASILGPFFDRIIATEAQYRKALPVADVEKAFQEHSEKVESEPTVSMAIQKALAGAGEKNLICITGSIFTASEAFDYFGKSFDD
jgi:dihydrofolate synthase/folylpolyglutamate synthase